MSEFKLDTSGAIRLVPAASDPDGPIYAWADLDPFTQGYLEALFATPEGTRDGKGLAAYGHKFRNLAPETLARIIADCAKHLSGGGAWRSEHSEAGAIFWRGRQLGDAKGFPPLTLYLGDDGRVYLREARP